MEFLFAPRCRDMQVYTLICKSIGKIIFHEAVPFLRSGHIKARAKLVLGIGCSKLVHPTLKLARIRE